MAAKQNAPIKGKAAAPPPEKLALAWVTFKAPASGEVVADTPLPEGWESSEEAPGGLTPAADWQKPGEYLEGEYLHAAAGVGPNKSAIYTFRIQTDQGPKIVSVWGSTILDDRMSKLGPARGDVLLIVYQGTVKTARALSPAKSFMVRRK